MFKNFKVDIELAICGILIVFSCIAPTINATPTQEWTYHKTSDSQHPNGDEQAIVWLMNVARQNPQTEGVWLATSSESDIASGRDYFKVDTTLLQSEFADYTAKPPAAFDVRLYNAAYDHSLDLITRDAQDHNGQFDRIKQQDFNYQNVRGSVAAYASNALNAHAMWNIDWESNDDTGMQSSRGHRSAIMSLDGDYTNVGIAAVPENNSNTGVGPLVTTGNYAKARISAADHFNLFLVGTVWKDANGNARYDASEGYENVTITPNQGNYYAVTSVGGGYAIPITEKGQYQVTFSGSNINTVTKTIVIENNSILLDYLVGEPITDPEETTSDSDKTSDTALEIELAKYPVISEVYSLEKGGPTENSTAQFHGGISLNNSDFELTKESVVQLNDTITVGGVIIPEQSHIGQQADILVIGLYTPDSSNSNCDPKEGSYYMNTGNENNYCSWIVEGVKAGEYCNPNANATVRRQNVDSYWQSWNGNLTELASLYTVTLSEQVILTADEGKVLYRDKPDYIGYVCLNFGYRLHDSTCGENEIDCCMQTGKNCPIIFNGETINFSVHE